MLSVYKSTASLEVNEVLGLVKKRHPHARAIVVRKELGLEDLLYFSLFLALKAFQNRPAESHARSLELEWLCRLACTPNVSKALERTAPQGEEKVISSTVGFENKLKKKLGISGKKINAISDVKFLSEFYGISEAALKNYSVLDLARERMAVACAK